MVNYLGVDSKKFIRKGVTNDFLAMTGIGIEVKSYDYFKEKFAGILSNLLKKRGIAPDKAVYKSYDLQRLGLTHDFYIEFYESIVEHIDKLYFFYSYFNSTPATKEIRIFPFTGQKSISFIDFIISHLDVSYPHICAWDLIQQFGY